MDFRHTRSSRGIVDLFQRKYLGNGRYYQRMNCKGLQVGDTFTTELVSNSPNPMSFTCDKIISVNDSKGVFPDDEMRKNAYVEAEFIDPSYNGKNEYIIAMSFGSVK